MLMVFALSLDVSAKKKPNPVIKYNLEASCQNEDKADAVSFSCGITDSQTAFIYGFTVTNNTDKRIYIEWENARFDEDRLVFGTDSRLTMGNPKADEAVPANSKSICRAITNQTRAGAEYLINYLYNPKKLKSEPGKKSEIKLIIPIRFSDDSVEDYFLVFSVWYEMPSKNE